MFKIIKSYIGKALRILLPSKWIRIAKNPLLVPGYYKQFVEESERAIDIVSCRENLEDGYWESVLRKQAHILDKGLWACDFEPGHGKTYRLQAENAIGNISSSKISSDESLQWAINVINDYDKSQEIGSSSCNTDQSPEISFDFDCFNKLVKSRRSIRAFKEQTIEKDVFEKMLETGIWAPSSCNKQTLRIFASNNPELASQCLSTCKGGTCFSEFIPGFICFAADLRPYVMPDEMWLPQVDVGMASQNICLAATALGLSITPLSWCQHDADEEKKLRDLLNIPSYCRIIVNGVVGYPAVISSIPERKKFESFTSLS